jgi:hypothetical protein
MAAMPNPLIMFNRLKLAALSFTLALAGAHGAWD